MLAVSILSLWLNQGPVPDWFITKRLTSSQPRKSLTKIKAVKEQSVQQYKDQESVDNDSRFIEKIKNKLCSKNIQSLFETGHFYTL